MTKSRFLLLSAATTLIVTMVAVAATYTLLDWSLPSLRAAVQRPETQAAIKREVEAASMKSQAAIARRAAEFRAFVEQRKAGAEPFSKDVVSTYGKWRVLKSRLPFTDSEGHTKYVVERFGEHIFTPQELSDKIRTISQDAVRDLDQEQNNLAVAIRKEILGRPLAAGEITAAQDELNAAIARTASAAQGDVVKGATVLAVAEVTATVTTQVLTRLGVSAGVLAAGAGTSWWTLGAGAAIAFAVSALWDWIDNPAGDIQRNVEASLDGLAVKGSDAILEEMSKVLNARHGLWQRAATEMH